jgi:hypothetical protein
LIRAVAGSKTWSSIMVGKATSSAVDADRIAAALKASAPAVMKVFILIIITFIDFPI